MKNKILYLVVFAFFINFLELKSEDLDSVINQEYSSLYYDFENPYIKINPYGVNPLSALIKFETENPTKVKIIIKDIYSKKNDFIQKIDEFKISHTIPIFYLYPENDNIIELIIEDLAGNINKKELTIKTESLKSKYPIIISKLFSNKLEFILLEYGAYGEKGRIPFVIDSFGNIRAGFEIENYFANVFINSENNLVFSKGNKIYEYNLLGKLVREVSMGIYFSHHDIKELNNGNYILTVTKKDSILEYKDENIQTIEDYIIEIDKSGNIIKEWDFKKILDTERRVVANLREDWLHINSVFYDEERNEIIVSANFQGIFSVDYDDNLKWLLSDPTGYSETFKEKLLTKDDTNSNFRFPYGQHEARKLDNGNILVFDNNSIHFDFDNQLNPKLKKLIPENNEYSRIVEYRIDREKMKVYQEYEYYDKKLWSKTISGVKKYGDNYLITYGHLIDQNKNMYGKIRKINKDKEIEYDFDIIYRDNNGAALYRSTILK